MPNTHRRRRRDETRQFRLVGVGGVYWAYMCKAAVVGLRCGQYCKLQVYNMQQATVMTVKSCKEMGGATSVMSVISGARSVMVG